MANKFAKLTFTDAVKEIQDLMGSRKNYARFEEHGPLSNHELGENEAAFISQRDSFYMSSVSETGWPYIQHRGGPQGFVRVLSEHEIGFADYSGNRQYITVGNLKGNNRVALIMVDYPNRARLKILGTAHLIDQSSDPEKLKLLTSENYKAKVERGFIIQVEALDWNCPQHISPRWTAEEIHTGLLPLRTKLESFEKEIAVLKARLKKYEGGDL